MERRAAVTGRERGLRSVEEGAEGLADGHGAGRQAAGNRRDSGDHR